MATKIENLELDIAFYQELKPYLDKIALHNANSLVLCEKTILFMLKHGLIQISTLFEQVMAYLSGSIVSSKDAYDLSNGADCKLITVRYTSSKENYTAPVAKISNKTGTLYVMCYERYTEKFYYFAIPHYAYKNIPSSSNIEIPFNLNYSPRRVSRGVKKYANWWDFECVTLDEVAQVCGQSGTNPVTQQSNAGLTFASGCIVFEDDEV